MVLKNKWKLEKQISNSKGQKLVKKSLGQTTGSSQKRTPYMYELT